MSDNWTNGIGLIEGYEGASLVPCMLEWFETDGDAWYVTVEIMKDDCPYTTKLFHVDEIWFENKNKVICDLVEFIQGDQVYTDAITIYLCTTGYKTLNELFATDTPVVNVNNVDNVNVVTMEDLDEMDISTDFSDESTEILINEITPTPRSSTTDDREPKRQRLEASESDSEDSDYNEEMESDSESYETETIEVPVKKRGWFSWLW